MRFRYCFLDVGVWSWTAGTVGLTNSSSPSSPTVGPCALKYHSRMWYMQFAIVHLWPRTTQVLSLSQHRLGCFSIGSTVTKICLHCFSPQQNTLKRHCFVCDEISLIYRQCFEIYRWIELYEYKSVFIKHMIAVLHSVLLTDLRTQLGTTDVCPWFYLNPDVTHEVRLRVLGGY